MRGGGASLPRFIALFLPWLIRRALRRKLHGVYARGAWDTLPTGGLILAANHHSWWDLYLAWFIGQRLGRKLSGVMLSTTLARFPFFRPLGAVGQSEVREALRRLKRGEVVIVFPEGALKPPGKLGRTERGVTFLAEKAQVPVYPLALRVVMRGAQHPEALLLLGEPTSPAELGEALDALLDELAATVQQAAPETPPPGFEQWLGGARSTHERAAWVGRLFR